MDFTELSSPRSFSQEHVKKLHSHIEGLNSEQKRAVFHKKGPLLVIAGAGSGKTRVATLRIARLISEGVDPKAIVGLTFTNKAAKEMRERVHALVGSSILVSTFHSLGARILREFAHLLDYPSSFVIYDEADREKLMKSCLRRFGVGSEDEDNVLQADDAIRLISQWKNSSRGDTTTPPQEIADIFRVYQDELKKAAAMDFDDLQYRTLELLKGYEEVRQALRSRWQYLLVDEYQDTNDVQSEIAALLAGDESNIFAVGDPDQSIYSWRGANLEHILSFRTRFPGAQEIRLEKNYRSTNIILKASNAVIQNNLKRLEKNLWSDRGDGSHILCYVARNERQEAEYVIQGIQALAKDKNIPLSEMAILYRTNAQSRSFEDELIRNHLPYVIWGGLSFYQRREVKDVISFARLGFMPQDVIAFERVINIPKRGIGTTTIEKLSQYASQMNIPIVSLVLQIVADNFVLSKFPGLTITFTGKQKKGLIQFCEVITTLRRISSDSHSAFHLISSAIHDTGYLTYLEEEAEENYIERRENLEQLLAKAMEWDQDWEERKNDPDEKGHNSITRFFEMLSLETSVQESRQTGDRVTLATVHNAKGLEFSSVFLVGLEEDLFPHINVKFKKGSDIDQDIEEERRLMYVGMTRAKDLLSISLSQSRMLWGGFRTMRPSRFLYEIPEGFLRKVSRFPSLSSTARDYSAKPSQELEEKSPELTDVGYSAPSNRQSIDEEYAVGDIILHKNYGIGKILAVSSSSLGIAYDIRFTADSSVKKIIGKFAPLQKVSSQ